MISLQQFYFAKMYLFRQYSEWEKEWELTRCDWRPKQKQKIHRKNRKFHRLWRIKLYIYSLNMWSVVFTSFSVLFASFFSPFQCNSLNETRCVFVSDSLNCVHKHARLQAHILYSGHLRAILLFDFHLMGKDFYRIFGYITFNTYI